MEPKGSGFLGKLWYVHVETWCKIASFHTDSYFIFDSQLLKKFCLQRIILQSCSSNILWKNTRLRVNLKKCRSPAPVICNIKPCIFFQSLQLPESSSCTGITVFICVKVSFQHLQLQKEAENTLEVYFNSSKTPKQILKPQDAFIIFFMGKSGESTAWFFLFDVDSTASVSRSPAMAVSVTAKQLGIKEGRNES